MNKTPITAKQMEALLATYYLGSSLVTGGGVAKQDSWLCIIIGTLLALLLLWLYASVIDLYPGHDFYDNIIRSCGNIPGKMLVLVISLYALLFGGQILRNEAEFIHVVNLTDTPLVAILASLLGASIYILKYRTFTLARVAKFLLPLIYASILLTVVLSLKDWQLSNIKPVLNSGFPAIAQGSVLVLSLPFGETAVCASLFGRLDGKAKTYPVLLKGALLAFCVLLLASFRNLFVLGYSAGYYMFPSYAAVSVISFGEFFTRIEVLIGIDLLLSGVFKISVMLFAFCYGSAKILGLKDYKPVVAVCGLALMTVSLYIVQNVQEMNQFISRIPYYSLPVQVLVPLTALIAGKLRGRSKASRTPAVSG